MGIPTFMRTPYHPDPAGLDIALIGMPCDGGVTNRPGTRHGPREIRNQSSLMRSIHHVTRVDPYALCEIADITILSVLLAWLVLAEIPSTNSLLGGILVVTAVGGMAIYRIFERPRAHTSASASASD